LKQAAHSDEIFGRLVSSKSKKYSHGTSGLHMFLRTRAATHQNPALSGSDSIYMNANNPKSDVWAWRNYLFDFSATTNMSNISAKAN